VGDGVSLVLPNEKARLWVMCVMYLFRLMDEYILYIYTVVCIVLGWAARTCAEFQRPKSDGTHDPHDPHT